jgi:hypothetical protein
MGKNVSFKGIGNANGGVVSSPSHSKEKIDPMLWGRPGHLSDEEAETFVRFVLVGCAFSMTRGYHHGRCHFDPAVMEHTDLFRFSLHVCVSYLSIYLHLSLYVVQIQSRSRWPWR